MWNPCLKSLLLASVVLATPSLASPYPDIYVFGDSLYDNGQYDGLRFTNRVGPDYQNSPYGPVSPNYIAAGLRLTEAAPSRDGGINYAVTGNESTQVLESITADTTYQNPYALDRPDSGLDPNFNSFFYDLDRTGRSLRRSAIYIMDGGGNDVGNGKVFNDETAGLVADNMVTAANALKGRGAKYVVLANVPDLGLAPGGISFGDFATTQITSINSQIQQLVGRDNILIFNAFGMLQEVAANPAAYGVPLTSEQFSRSCFSTSEDTCSGGNAAAKIDGTNPDPDQFFFNDFRHPTTIGQQISADYMLSLLQAPGEIALLPQMGIDEMQAQWRSARPIMQANRWRATTRTGSYSVWGGANYNEDDHEGNYHNTGTNEATQYNLGVNFRPAESWYVGAQLGRADSELDFDNSPSHYEMDSLNITLLAGFHRGPWFAEGTVGYSDLDYDSLKRTFALGPLLQRTESADTSGSALGLKINAGLNVVDSKENYHFGPTWGFEYIDTEVDGYVEKSGTATALRVSDMDSTSAIGSAGLFGDMQPGFCDCSVYSELTYRFYIDNAETDPRIGLESVPGNSAKLPGFKQDDEGIRWDLGLAATIAQSIDLNIGGGFTSTDDGDAFWYGAELIYSF